MVPANRRGGISKPWQSCRWYYIFIISPHSRLCYFVERIISPHSRLCYFATRVFMWHHYCSRNRSGCCRPEAGGQISTSKNYECACITCSLCSVLNRQNWHNSKKILMFIEVKKIKKSCLRSIFAKLGVEKRQSVLPTWVRIIMVFFLL